MADLIFPTACDFLGKCRDLLHAANLRHGRDGFTSPPKEGMLRIFFARKIRRLQPGLVPEASMLTTRPLKPLVCELLLLQILLLVTHLYTNYWLDIYDGAPAWRWLGEYVTLDKTFKCSFQTGSSSRPSYFQIFFLIAFLDQAFVINIIQ